MQLAISLPTRGRPERIIETLKHNVALWRDPNTALWVMVDEDDIPTQKVLEHFKPAPPLPSQKIGISIRPREDTVIEKFNRIVECEPDADLYMTGADDDLIMTEGYDSRMLEAAKIFPDGIGLVYGHMANQSLPRMTGLTSKLVHRFGIYMCPPYFPFWFVDHWADDIAKMIGRICFADVTSDQTRPGKTIGLRDLVWWSCWFDAAFPLRREIAEQILDSPDFASSEWRKQLLRRNVPLLAYTSMTTNSFLRGHVDAIQQAWGDAPIEDRYLRVLHRAQALLPKLEQMNQGNPVWNDLKALLIPAKAA